MFEDHRPRGLSERLLALRRFSLLSALPASDLAMLARLSRDRDYGPGQTLATAGELVHTVQLLLSGSARLSRSGAAPESAGAFDTVGLLPLAAGTRHLVTAVAVEPVHALEIDGDLVAEVLEDNFALFLRVLRLAARSASGPGQALGFPDVLERAVAPAAPPEHLASDLASPSGAARKLLLLREVALFHTAPLDGLAAFAKGLSQICLPAGAQLETGGESGELLIVVAGEAEVRSLHSERAVKRKRLAGPAAVVGAVDALTTGAARLLITARGGEVHLLRGSAADLLDTIEDHHAMGGSLLAALVALPLTSDLNLAPAGDLR